MALLLPPIRAPCRYLFSAWSKLYMWTAILASLLLLNHWFNRPCTLRCYVFLSMYEYIRKNSWNSLWKWLFSEHFVYLHQEPRSSLAQNDSIDNKTATQRLSTLAQHWKCLLFSTGGAINMPKTFRYLMAWAWKNGIPSLAPISKAPGVMALTSGKQVKVLCQHSDNYFTHITASTIGESILFLYAVSDLD